jgi:NADH:ubiquinone reductase (H+-translocating)
MIVRQPPRIVVVGAGYAGLSTALRLARQAGGRARVELVDGRAEHQLITRLHEVAAGRLASAAAAVPLGMLLAGTGIRLQRAWVEGIDLEHGQVTTSAGLLNYDTLVLAPGSRTDYRGVPGAAELALPLRTLEDALRLRETFGNSRRAARIGGAERGSELTFLVVGGGYTGIELAAELASRSGRRAPRMRIGLLEVGPRLLPGGDGWLAREAVAGLERLGVQLFLGLPALSVEAGGVQVQNGEVEARQVVWATGVRAPRLLAGSGLHVGHDGRALVDSGLAAIGHSEVLVLGDAAAAADGTDHRCRHRPRSLGNRRRARPTTWQRHYAAEARSRSCRGWRARRCRSDRMTDWPASAAWRWPTRRQCSSNTGRRTLPQPARRADPTAVPVRAPAPVGMDAQPPAVHTSAAKRSQCGVVSERAA